MHEPRKTIEPARNLWVSVLIIAIRDLAASAEREREEAERWVGAYMSHEFRTVALYAGFEPDPIWHWCRKLIAMPKEDRRSFIKERFRTDPLPRETREFQTSSERR